MKTNQVGNRIAVLAATLGLGLTVPALGSAQACLGLPTTGGQAALSGTVGFPEGATAYGVSGVYDMTGPVTVFGSYTLTSPDVEGAESVNTFGGGAALDLAPMASSLPAAASVCPTASASYTSLDTGLGGDLSLLTVPVGLGLGTTVSVGEGGATLTPFAIPQYIYSRVSFAGESTSETYFGLSGGTSIGLGAFYAGGSVFKAFEEGMDAVFSVHGGWIF